MEAVPRLPMLSFEMKISPVCPDFATPFKALISTYYGEDGHLYDREIIELENLRNSACRAARDVTGVSILKRYYCQINSLYNRFSAIENPIGVQCAWVDIYSGQTTVGDLDFELACILYNIGALHAELGGLDSRQTMDEMKICCTHFQCAAWAFKHLTENKKFCRSSDLSNDILYFMVQIMLAQAQECILEKSMLDNRKPLIVAKVTAQVVEFYKCAMSMLQQGAMNTSSQPSIVEVVGSKLFKHWKKYVEFKVAYYDSVCALYMGNAADEQQKMGERVAWYELADTKLKTAGAMAKQLDETATSINDALIFVSDVITEKLSNAKKENDFIYHEKIPAPASLPEVKGATLVKGIPFNICDPEVSGSDIFSRLVPIEAHETASIYSARKDEILRNARIKIEEKTQELVAYLSSLQLEKNWLRAPKEDAIPDELVDACAELSLHPESIDEVESTLNKLDAISEETGKIIAESKNLLAEEEEKEREHQEKFGKRPPSLIVLELSKELSKHEETHKKAIESNRSLRENFDQHKEDIMVMMSSSASKIAAILPSNNNIKVDEEVISKMERLFDKIEEMKTQRIMLEEQLTNAMDQDNVMKLVLAHPRNEIEKIFDEEIKKYDKIVDLIEQNLSAQANILKAMTECNAAYSETRKEVIEVQSNRKTRIASLLYTFQVFKELQVNSLKGLEFYQKFQMIITRLNARIRGVMKVQDEERAQFVQAQTNRILMSHGGNNGASLVTTPMSFPVVPGTTMMNELSLLPPAAQPTAPIPPATGAKLKDYLPFMIRPKGVAGSAAVPGMVSLTPTPPSVPQPTHLQQPALLPQNPAVAGHHNQHHQQVNMARPVVQPQQYSPPPPYSNAISSSHMNNNYSLPVAINSMAAGRYPSQTVTGYQQPRPPISSVLPVGPPNLPYPINQLQHPMPNSDPGSIPPYPVSQPQHPLPQNQGYQPSPSPAQSSFGQISKLQPLYNYPNASMTPSKPTTTITPAAQPTPPPPAPYQQPQQQPVQPTNSQAPPYPTSYGGTYAAAMPQPSSQANYPATYPMTSNYSPNAQQQKPLPQPPPSASPYYYQPQQQQQQNTPPRYSNIQPQFPLTPYPVAGSNQTTVSYPMPNPVVNSGGGGGQPQHQHPYANATNSMPQQPVTTAATNNPASAAEAMAAQLERESKTGWPVLTPTPAISDSAVINGEAKPAATTTAADSNKLPDILSTMSINGQSMVATNMPVAALVTATIPPGKTNVTGSPAPPSQPKMAMTDNSGGGKKTDESLPVGDSRQVSSNEKPTDLLSQFDPLFT